MALLTIVAALSALAGVRQAGAVSTPGTPAASASPANADQPGTLTVGPGRPRVGAVSRATLSDPDGVVSVAWQWQRSSDRNAWTDIAFATRESYEAVTADEGEYLRVEASYTDGDGAGKSLVAAFPNVVAEREAHPDLTVVTLVSGLTIPWGVAFTPDGTMLFTQRSGVLSRRLAAGGVRTVTASFSDLYSSGEAGLMAIAVDPNFAANRRFYTCQTSSSSTAEVIAWTIDAGYATATRVNDPLVGSIPAASRHSGCRLRFGPSGYLWIATGDAAVGTHPQDLSSLGGKVLRVNATTGAAAPGNPFNSRIYSYGHRNVQGLALRPGTSQMWSVEHGPDVDDEINLLVSGGNYGWDPVPGYNENVAMTDLVKYPAAVEAKWSSGERTLATSGGIFLDGSGWDEWEGRLAVANLKGRSLHLFEFTAAGKLVSQVVVPELDGTNGRLRTPVIGPDGALYVTTSNGGGGDKILKVVPGHAPEFPSPTVTLQVQENSGAAAVIGTVSATDPDGDTLTYTLGGTNSDSFTIDRQAVLRSAEDFDHEAKDSYEVTVTATDPSGLSDTTTVTVTVSDVDEPADISFSAASSVTADGNALGVDENHTGTVATFSASDPERKAGLTYTWSLGGADASDFTIPAGVLAFANTPDYERPADAGRNNVYDVTVNALDSDGKTGRVAVTVSVAAVNEPPVISGDATPGLEEEGGVLVGTYAAADPERATTAWLPLGGADSDEFEFNATSGRLTLHAVPDFEDARDSDGDNVYEVILGASAGGDTTTLQVSLTVTNRDEAGTLALPVTRPQAEAEYLARLDDPDGVVSTTWTWERSTSRTGRWASVSGAVDGVTTSAYTPATADIGSYLRATATYEDGHGPDKSRVAVSSSTVRAKPAVNNPPAFADTTATRSVAETAGANAPVGARVTASDPDSGDSVRYELDPTSDLFVVDPASGQIRVRKAESLDHETAPSHTVTVKASDSSNTSGAIEVTITVTDVNEAPTAGDDRATATEDESVTISVLDNDSDPEDDAGDLTVSAGTARNGHVAVNVPQGPGELYTITYTPRANYHGADSFTYTVRDSGSPARSDTATVSINVDAVNDAPTFPSATAARGVSASAGEGDRVGAPVTASDVDSGDRISYRLSGADGFAFDIGRDSGQITVGAGTTFDIATQDTYSVTVEADDGNGGTASVDVTITVTTGRISPPIIIGPIGPGGGGPPPGPTPSEADFEWTVTHDLDALDPDHGAPTGMWSDGATLWLADNAEGASDAVYAYDLERGERAEEREFALDQQNRAPRGVWSDGVTAWVSDSGRDRLFAYDLASGAPLPDRDLELASRNADARGIWSGGRAMWVLDDRRDALFAYDLASGALLAEYELGTDNDQPHGVWFDGTTLWVSNHDPKRLYAYRLPAAPEAPAAGDAEPVVLERSADLDFTGVSKAGNNSPRGLWSDGAVMYVADANDGKVYSYNMPDAIDARLASLTLDGVAIAAFSPLRHDYEGVAADGVTQTTVTAEAAQSGATVAIDPPDADEEAAGHQVALAGVGEIAVTVTVTSADRSRDRVYRVSLPDPGPAPWPHCLRGAVAVGFSLVVYEGGRLGDLVACAESRAITALYVLDGGEWVSYIAGAPDVVNAGFGALFAGGVPAFTPLVARSDGPPSDDPVGALGEQPPWQECLLGGVAEGFSLVVYEGGSVRELVDCAERLGIATVFALVEGEYVAYILGAPDAVNARFRAVFPDGVPAATPLIVRRRAPRQAVRSRTAPRVAASFSPRACRRWRASVIR